MDQGSYMKSVYRLLGKFKRLIFIYLFFRLFQNNPGSKTACVPQLLANNKSLVYVFQKYGGITMCVSLIRLNSANTF